MAPNSVANVDDHCGLLYGLVAFEVDTRKVEIVPQTWQDLLNDRYSGQVTFAGDPLSSTVGALAVQAASLANGGGQGDPTPGLSFFADLHQAGNDADAWSLGVGSTG